MPDVTRSTHAYLLRLRRAQNGQRPVWRYELEAADGSVRHQFRTLDGMMNFLARLTDEGLTDLAQSRTSHDGSVV